MGEGFGFTLGDRSFFANLHVGMGEGGLRASASAGSPRKASLGRGGEASKNQGINPNL